MASRSILYHCRRDGDKALLQSPLHQILQHELTKTYPIAFTSVPSVRVRWPEIRKSGRAKLAGQSFILAVSRSGLKMRGQLWHSNNYQTVIYRLQGNGDVLGAIYQRMFSQRPTSAGVKRMLILDRFRESHHIRVVRHVVNREKCPRNVHIRATYYAMQGRALLVHIPVLFRAVSVGRNRLPGDVWTLTMRRDGAVEKCVEI